MTALNVPPITWIEDATGLEEAARALAHAEAVGLDTETTGLDPHRARLRLIQLATPETVYLIDASRFSDLGPLKAILEAPRPIKILHHAKFDAKFLRRRYGIRLAGIFDTMLASQLLGSSEGHSLAAVASRWAGITLDKTMQRSDWSGALSEEQVRYAAHDAAVLLALREAMRPALLTEKLGRVAALEFAAAPAIGGIELAGIRLDGVKWLALAREREREHAALAEALHRALAAADPQLALFPDHAASTLNLNSVPQVMRALAQLGIQVPDTDDLTLGPLASSHPVIAKLLEYRHAAKALSSYGESFLSYIHPVTGRIHPEFHQLGADTGRMAASNPNIQQIPNQERYRACFVADPGNQLVIADYSQIELRILAEVSGDAQLRHAFETGADLHRLTAAMMFGIPLDEVSKDARQRAKALNFGMVYGMGPSGLATRIGSTLDEAKELIDRYFAAYPGVRAWLRQAARKAVESGECTTLGGRRIRFAIPDPENRRAIAGIERVGKNAPLQGTSADITKRAIALLDSRLPPETRIVNVVHDEIVVEAPTDAAPHVAALLRETMREAAETYLKRVPVSVEADVAEAWIK
ncbi:DNA polymerase I [compost metagenome]